MLMPLRRQAVMRELDGLKAGNTLLGYQVREATAFLEELQASALLSRMHSIKHAPASHA
jgi:hypothetical protein